MSATMRSTPASGSSAALRFADFVLTLRGETQPLLSLDRDIAPGQCLAIMGASGRGKSTLLLAIAGFAPPWARTTGSISMDGTRLDDLPPEQRHMGLMLQDDLLFPHLCVGDNLLFGLTSALKGRAERRHRVEMALAEAGLGGLFTRAPGSLSGGQRSRVSLLRTLLSEPRALLLDEPFSKLDGTTRGTIRALVFEAAQARGLPVLLVTHELRDAAAAGAEIITLADAPSV
jgi:putative thiamine transport system ATP-binding protein